jgi:hypothetical protein
MYKCDDPDCTWWGEHPAPRAKCPACHSGIKPIHYILHDSFKNTQVDEFDEVKQQLRELVMIFAGVCEMDPRLLGCVLMLMFFDKDQVNENTLAKKCRGWSRQWLNEKLKPFKDKGWLR